MPALPILSYDEAQKVGADLHDHWLRLTGAAPIGRDDLGWADLVQFVTRKACERVVAREDVEGMPTWRRPTRRTGLDGRRTPRARVRPTLAASRAPAILAVSRIRGERG